jgi:transcription elongation factor GreA
MLEAAKKQLGEEIERLNHELNVTLPETFKKAVALGDLKENGDYHAAKERQAFVSNRLSNLRQRLAKLNSIDLAKIPADSAGLGSKLVVQDQATKENESYEIVVPDSMDLDDPTQISIASPMGRAMVEKKVGDIVMVQLPGRIRKLKILELSTFHQQNADLAGPA